MANILVVLHFHDGLIVDFGVAIIWMMRTATVVQRGLVMRNKLR